MILDLPLKQVKPDPEQPRKTFKEETIRELAESIKERGLKQPITVRPCGDIYLIIMGERRYRAHVMGGLPTIKAIVQPDGATKEELLMDQMIENMQRENMNAIETASGLKLFIDAGWTIEKTAKTMGYSVETVERKLSLNSLEDKIKKYVASGQIPESVGLLLTRLSSEGQYLALRKIKNKPHSQAKPIIDAILDQEQQVGLFALEEPLKAKKSLIRSYNMAMLALVGFARKITGDDYRILAHGLDDGRLGKRIAEIDLAIKTLNRIKRELNIYQAAKRLRGGEAA